MKNLRVLICCLLILSMLCACGRKEDEIEMPVNFYYSNNEITYNSPVGVIQSEVREGIGFQENLTALMDAYLRGPVSADLHMLIPQDASLVSCEEESGVIHILMSESFAKLSGVKLSAACSALLLTFRDYTGAEALIISAEGTQLDGKDEIMLSLDDLVLIDTAEVEE